mmetsp:Transcript_35614/g.69774  ORF Transcript_35614/g.69774 Transcript_35614/m.69774 type:complete len:212 (+) Transcript_35614:228-863(+)
MVCGRYDEEITAEQSLVYSNYMKRRLSLRKKQPTAKLRSEMDVADTWSQKKAAPHDGSVAALNAKALLRAAGQCWLSEQAVRQLGTLSSGIPEPLFEELSAVKADAHGRRLSDASGASTLQQSVSFNGNDAQSGASGEGISYSRESSTSGSNQGRLSGAGSSSNRSLSRSDEEEGEAERGETELETELAKKMERAFALLGVSTGEEMKGKR